MLYHITAVYIYIYIVLHETLILPVLMYGSGAILWKEEERSKTRGVQIHNHRGLLGVRRMDRVPIAQIRELCRVMKGVMKGLMKVFSGELAMWRG